MVLVYYFCKGSKSLSYFISLVSKSIASNIAYCISTNIYWSSTKCEELWEADRPVTPAQGYYSPVFGANMDTVQGRMTFILIRGIRRYTMEHTFKSAGRIRELHGQYEFEHSQETPRDVNLRQNRKQTFRDKRIYIKKHEDFIINMYLYFLSIYGYLAALGLCCSTWTLSCGMWGLVLWPGIKPRAPALGVLSLSHWTFREVPKHEHFKVLYVFKNRHRVSPEWSAWLDFGGMRRQLHQEMGLKRQLGLELWRLLDIIS